MVPASQILAPPLLQLCIGTYCIIITTKYCHCVPSPPPPADKSAENSRPRVRTFVGSSGSFARILYNPSNSWQKKSGQRQAQAAVGGPGQNKGNPFMHSAPTSVQGDVWYLLLLSTGYVDRYLVKNIFCRPRLLICYNYIWLIWLAWVCDLLIHV